MRLFLIIALVLFILALICAVGPTTVANASWPVWTIAAFISWLIDALVGSSIKVG